MKAMRKCNDEIYQLAKDQPHQALVQKLKNKRFRPFCLCLPGVMFVTRGSKNSLFFVFDFLSNLDCGQWYKFWICQSLPMNIYIRLKIKPNSVRIRFLELSSFYSSLDGIWTHTIDTLQHHSHSLTSSALNHSTTSTP